MPDKFPRTPGDGEAEPGVSEITNRRWELAGCGDVWIMIDNQKPIYILASSFWIVYARVEDWNTLYTV